VDDLIVNLPPLSGHCSATEAPGLASKSIGTRCEKWRLSFTGAMTNGRTSMSVVGGGGPGWRRWSARWIGRQVVLLERT
jgi:hypothetical protein